MRFWFGKNKNNESVQEQNTSWNSIQSSLAKLSINNNGQIIELPDNLEYIQGKTASASLSGGNITLESRYIGFKIGSNIVSVRINEKTNHIKIELIKNATSTEKSEN